MACSCRRRHSTYMAQPLRTSCNYQDPVCYSPEEPVCTGTTTGGWSSFRKPTPQEKAIFNQAVSGLVGVVYEPLYVSTQVVAGTNYLFVVKTTVPGPSCFVDIVTVGVFAALNGTITLGEIKTVRPQ